MINVNERTNGLGKAQDLAATEASAVAALAERGVLRPEELLAFNTPVAILGWCRWWDGQRGVGKELLAERIRSGAPPPIRRHRLDDERRYLAAIEAWLKRHFPELCDPEPHYAAVAAVIRLHQRYGKGTLTIQEHGETIRAAVKVPEPEEGEPR